MTLAYACILVAALLPYLWTVVAKSAAPKFDNRDPRAWLAKQDNPKVHRANGAQLNAFEAFAPFAAAVLMAQAAGVDPGRIGTLAVTFVALRVLHGLLYVGNKPTFRSLAWLAALACVVVLMALAIAAAGG